MNIVQNFLTKNPCYKINRTIKVKGLMLHSVGCPQPSAQVFLKNWNSADYDRACVHAFIDANTGTVYQTLPWNHRGWHGGGSSNNTHIGVEMCEPDSIRYTGGSTFKDLDSARTKAAVLRTYKAAVSLFAYLCDLYHLNPMMDIVSHAEGHELGIASNHGDPEHLWKKYGLSMDQFRSDVKKQMEGEDDMTKEEVIKIIQEYEAEKAKKPVSTWAKPAWDKAKKKGVMDGINPKGTPTREQIAAILDRLGLL